MSHSWQLPQEPEPRTSGPGVACGGRGQPDSAVSGYRHVYLEGMEEASIFVHVAISDVSGKVSPTAGPPTHPSRDRP